MKTKILSVIIVFIVTLCSHLVKGQDSYELLSNYYSMFSEIAVENDFLLNKGFIDPNHLQNAKIIEHSTTDFVITNPQDWRHIYEKVRLSEVNQQSILAPINTFWDISTIDSKNNTNIPIGMIDIEGKFLHPDLIEDHFDSDEGKIKSTAPFETIRIFSISNLQETAYSGQVTFSIDPNLYFSNSPNQIEHLEIDFDDGNGYQEFDLTHTQIPISYQSKGSKNLIFKVFTNSDTLISYSIIDIKVLEYLPPTFARTIFPNTQNNARINATISGGQYEVHLGCDNKLDKPVILVEGFDPLKVRQPGDLIEKYRDIGVWDNLSASGYDLVALKFNNNHDFIQNNAGVLKSLIDEINQDKEGHFENIIIGESMGGLVTRVALAELEADGIDHETGLYISYDSPHKGANIPLALQHFGHDALDITFIEVISFLLKVCRYTKLWGFLLDGAVDGVDDARDIVNSNNSNAARQMLIRHRNFPNEMNPDFLSFQTFLNNTGYPSTSRNIALINGSNNANQQWDDTGNNLSDLGESMVDEQIGCRCCGFKINLNMWVSSVNTSAKVSDIEIRVQAPLPCTQIETTNKNGYGTFDDKPWDISPGGFTSEDIDVWLLGLDEYFRFSFVPTVSSIDLDQTLIDGTNGTFYYNENGIANRSKLSIIQNNQTPFDDLYSDFFNSNHINGESFINSNGNEEALVSVLEIIEEQEIMHENMFLQNKTIQSGWNRGFEANRSITAGNNINPENWTTINPDRPSSEDIKIIDAGDFIIESGANVNFTASDEIVLRPGFHAAAGATFTAKIAPSSGSCNQPNGRISSASNGYNRTMPLPNIAISKKDKQVTFAVTNYSNSADDISYQWTLRGEDVELYSTENTFEAQSLNSGQYSITATINNSRSRSKVFQVLSENYQTDIDNKVSDFNSTLNQVIYPNPSSGELRMQLHVGVDTELRISIVNLKGQEIKILMNEFRNMGEYDEVFDVSDLREGIYIVQIQAQGKKITGKLIIQ